MATHKLSDRQIRRLNTHPQRSFKVADGGGLHLLVHHNGRHYWHLKFYLGGKERLYAIGTYPEVSLADAREEAAKAKKLIRDGIDPVDERKKSRFPKTSSDTFELIAKEWIATNRENWSRSYLRNLEEALENNLFPQIGKLPIKAITVPAMREALLVMQDRGALALLSQVRGWAS
jgi:Arm domain-containing DNA-binding protein/integrase-like protein